MKFKHTVNLGKLPCVCIFNCPLPHGGTPAGRSCRLTHLPLGSQANQNKHKFANDLQNEHFSKKLLGHFSAFSINLFYGSIFYVVHVSALS